MLPTLRSLLILMFITLAYPAVAAKTLLVMGDSLSAAYGIRKQDSWPALLSVRLHEKKLDYGMVNLSISGETSAGGRTRLAAALKTHRPAIVIIALGANDGLRGLPLAQLEANLAAMIVSSQAAGAKVLLAGMRLPPNYGPDYERQFVAIYTRLAKQYKTALLPFLLAGFATEREAFQADGLHPVAAMQPRILDNLWPVLQPLLAEDT